MLARPSRDDHHQVVRARTERHLLREEPAPEALGVEHPEALAILRTEAVEPHARSEEHTSELQSQSNLVCRLLLEKKNDRRRDGSHRANRQSRRLQQLRHSYVVA